MRFIAVLALSLFVSMSALSSIAGAKSDPQAELKAVDDKFCQAFNKEDVETVIGLYAKDATIMFPGGDIWLKGHAPIRQEFTEFFADCDTPTLVLHDTAYRASGNFGYGFGLFDMSYKDVKTGAMETMKGRFLSVMEKQGGKWVYVVDHASVPMSEGPEAPAGEQPKATEEHPK